MTTTETKLKKLNNKKMTLKSRITERRITAAMVLIVFLTTGIYSCMAQTQPLDNSSEPNHPISLVKNAPKTILHVADINYSAKAVALNSSINGAYEEIKPALRPVETGCISAEFLIPAILLVREIMRISGIPKSIKKMVPGQIPSVCQAC